MNRNACITASRCSDFMTKGKGEMFGETAKTYAKEIMLKRLGMEIEGPTTWQMEWGLEHEPDARYIYERSRSVKCELPGFVTMENFKNVGCTPDGLVGDDGLLEIKCPQWKAHIDYLLSDHPPKQYWQQIQFQMMVTGRKWDDFMIFNPIFPEQLIAKVIRVERDQDYINEIQSRIEPFEELIDEMMDKLNITQ